MNRGAFVTFEGGEGAGKTVQLARLAGVLEARGAEVVRTREPGGSPNAEALRALLLDPDRAWSPLARAFLNCASRTDHMRETIQPACARGAWVLCDRFADSTIAYQGYGEHIDTAFLRSLSAHAANGWTPDVTIVLDVPPEVGFARVSARGTSTWYERQDTRYHERVRAGFLEIAASDPGRCAVIDASGTPDAVHQAVVAAIRTRIGVELSARQG